MSAEAAHTAKCGVYAVQLEVDLKASEVVNAPNWVMIAILPQSIFTKVRG
jgi:acetamidase/formamidase